MAPQDMNKDVGVGEHARPPGASDNAPAREFIAWKCQGSFQAGLQPAGDTFGGPGIHFV